MGSGPGDLRIERSFGFDTETDDDYQKLLDKAIRVVDEEVLRKDSIVNSSASRKIVAMRWGVSPGLALDMATFPSRLEADLYAKFRTDLPSNFIFLATGGPEKKKENKTLFGMTEK